MLGLPDFEALRKEMQQTRVQMKASADVMKELTSAIKSLERTIQQNGGNSRR